MNKWIACILSLSICVQAQTSLGISWSDNIYLKPEQETGDMNVALSLEHKINTHSTVYASGSYAFEGLNEVWFRSGLKHSLYNKSFIQPFIGAAIQYQTLPDRIWFAAFGLGAQAHLQTVNPFMHFQISSHLLHDFQKQNELIWEFVRIGVFFNF